MQEASLPLLQADVTGWSDAELCKHLKDFFPLRNKGSRYVPHVWTELRSSMMFWVKSEGSPFQGVPPDIAQVFGLEGTQKAWS